MREITDTGFIVGDGYRDHEGGHLLTALLWDRQRNLIDLQYFQEVHRRTPRPGGLDQPSQKACRRRNDNRRSASPRPPTRRGSCHWHRNGAGHPARPLGSAARQRRNPPHRLGADLDAVAADLTGTNSTAAQYVVAWPGGSDRPNASNPRRPNRDRHLDHVWVTFRLQDVAYSLLLNSSNANSEVLIGFVRREL